MRAETQNAPTQADDRSSAGLSEQARVATILYVTSSGNLLGGAERCLLNLAVGIRKYGFEPVVVLPFRGGLYDALRHRRIAVHVIDLSVPRSRRELRSPILLWRALTLPVSVARLVRLIRQSNASVIHSNTSIIVAGSFAARLTGRPHVWHVRELLGGPLWVILRKVQLALSERVLCISSAVAQNVYPGSASSHSQVRVLPDGIDLDNRATSTARANEQVTRSPRVAMVGRINPWKGHDLFLHAARKVLNALPAAHFYVVGGHLDTYAAIYQRLLRLRFELGLEDAVHFIDQLEWEELQGFLLDMDIVVMPSVVPEGGGLVALEAMALGIPVVASAHGGPLDFIRHGINGMLVEPGSSQEIADRVLELAASRTLRRGMGLAGQRTVVSRYGMSIHVGRVAAIYSEIVRT